MKIDRIDHFVLTVTDIEKTCAFYCGVLGMELQTFGEGRKALTFGAQKFNLHQAGAEFEPKARKPVPGSEDFCLISSTPLAQVQAELKEHGIVVEQGPVERSGATGKIISLYLRDPDGNLIEISTYI